MILHDLDSLAKQFRRYIMLATNVNGMFVRNSLSEFGQDLDRRESQSVFDSICPEDIVILFELQLRTSDSDTSMTESDDSISYFKAFRLKVIIYGKDSDWKALNLVGNFRTSAFRNLFVNSGIYLEKITEPESANEFLNDVLWHRTDVNVDFSCHFKIEQVISTEEFESINEINIKEY